MTDRDQKQLGKTRWNIADQLRGAMNADDFRDYMLSFLFLRYLSGKYEHPLGDRDARQPGAGDGETGAVGKRDGFRPRFRIVALERSQADGKERDREDFWAGEEHHHLHWAELHDGAEASLHRLPVPRSLDEGGWRSRVLLVRQTMGSPARRGDC
jgi:type I restriction-modification system DNA methylase subunit